MAYIERMLKAGLLLKERYPVGVSHECIQHDNFCPILHGTGGCICDPDILVLVPNGDRYEVDRAGNLVQPRPYLMCAHGLERRQA